MPKLRKLNPQRSYRRCPDDPPGMILVMGPDTMLTMDAMVSCSAATCDASRPPYSRSCTVPCSTGLSLYRASWARIVRTVPLYVKPG
jgi:hypothetical protein